MARNLQAAVFGAGCWAEDNGIQPVATCTTGCGEYLIRSTLARSVASKINRNAAEPNVALVSSAMKHDFLGNFFNNHLLAHYKVKKIFQIRLF